MPQKTWAIGEETLAPADFNLYVQGQVVAQFANAGARDAWAAPPNGSLCVTTDDNVLWQRVAGAWVGALGQSGTYTPTLVGFVVGTGGAALNTATYAYVGPPGVGARGALTVGGQWTFGTTGISMTGPCEIGLPPGFQSPLGAVSPPVGNLNLMGAPGELSGYFHFLNNTHRLQMYYWSVAGGLIGRALVSATLPFNWVAGNGARWSATVPVVRV